MALKVVKSAIHYTETALDEIKLLKMVSDYQVVVVVVAASVNVDIMMFPGPRQCGQCEGVSPGRGGTGICTVGVFFLE